MELAGRLEQETGIRYAECRAFHPWRPMVRAVAERRLWRAMARRAKDAGREHFTHRPLKRLVRAAALEVRFNQQPVAAAKAHTVDLQIFHDPPDVIARL